MTAASDNTPAENPYDAVPYLAQAFPQTHPDRLAAAAKLNGLTPPLCDNARILELGCAAGGNLIPMAEAMPNSKFVGVDLSQRQLNDGLALIKDLNLTNIQLVHKNIADITKDFGTFDYIIAHGVYSWVPPSVADKMLQISRDNLSPHGIAYISYNIYPGWRLRGVVRDIMVYHTRNISDPAKRVAASRKLLNSLADIIPTEHAYGLLLNTEAKSLRASPDSQLAHDQLEEENIPCYFHEFAERAGSHDLKFISDAEPRMILGLDMPANLRAPLPPQTDLLDREQYCDFIRGTSFRRSLLCHSSCSPTPIFTAAGMKGLYLTSPLKPASPANDSFVGPKGMRLSASSPLANRLLLELTQAAPGRVLFDDLVQRGLVFAAADSTAAAREVTAEIVGDFLFKLYASRAIDIYSLPNFFVTTASERPLASTLARLQASRSNAAVGRLHYAVPLTPTARALIPLLDGTNDRSQLKSKLKGVSGPDGLMHDLSQLDSDLARLAINALLIA